MFLSIKMAARNLLRHKRRSLFTGGLACVAAIAAIVSLGYMSATFYAVAESTIRGGVGHLQIAKIAQFDGVEDFPLEHGLLVRDRTSIQSEIDKIAPNADLLPRIDFQGVISVGDQSLIFIGTALEPLKERVLTATGRRVVEGVGLEHVDPDNIYQVLVGKELARLLNVGVGDSVTLMTPTTLGGLNAADVTIVGIASLGVLEVDRTYLAAPIGLAQDLLRTESIGNLTIALPDGYDADLVVKTFKENAPEGITAKSWRELVSLYDQLVQIFSSQFSMFGFIIAVMIVLTLLNTVAMSILERQKESATLMSMGFKRRYVRWLYVLEGALLGFLGASVGAVLSVIIIIITNKSGIVMPAPPGSTQGYTLVIFIEKIAIIYTIAGIAILSLFAAWIASGTVRESNIMESFRYA